MTSAYLPTLVAKRHLDDAGTLAALTRVAVVLDDCPAPTAAGRTRCGLRGDLVAAGLAAVLLAAAAAVPWVVLTKLQRAALFSDTAPLYALWLPHKSWATLTSVLVVVAVVLWGPPLAARLPWRVLLAVTWATGLTWAMSVALIDGWRAGFADRQTDGNEYVPTVASVADMPDMLQGFTSRILEGVPGSWATHVAGHPPGALLVFVWLERIGLGGPVWAAWFLTVAGTSAALAVMVTVRALSEETVARRAAPFLALVPATVWIAVSADAMFMAVTAWGVALLALASTRRGGRSVLAAVPAGLLLGYGIFLSYGLVAMGLLAVAVFAAARSARPLIPAALAALAVVGVFYSFGFWWLDGYHLVVQRYYQGIAAARPFTYWGWGNFGSLVCAIGFAGAAGIARVLQPSLLRARSGLTLLVAGAALMIIAADLSALSKGETERIWLPFAIWLVAAGGALPVHHHRVWLALQGAMPIVIVSLVLTNW